MLPLYEAVPRDRLAWASELWRRYVLQSDLSFVAIMDCVDYGLLGMI